MGYHPQVILAGRRINDKMGKFIAEKTVKMMISSRSPYQRKPGRGLRADLQGELSDLSNSRVPDIVAELKTSYGIEVLVHDPTADPDEARAFYGVALASFEELKDLDALVVAVAHSFYQQQSLENIVKKLIPGGCLIDVKAIFDPEEAAKMDVNFWRL